MTIETEPFDAARYLDTPESQAALLTDAMESGDAGYIGDAIGVVARARGMADVAREAGIAPDALYDALRAVGDHSGRKTLVGVARALAARLAAQPVS